MVGFVLVSGMISVIASNSISVDASDMISVDVRICVLVIKARLWWPCALHASSTLWELISNFRPNSKC